MEKPVKDLQVCLKEEYNSHVDIVKDKMYNKRQLKYRCETNAESLLEKLKINL